MSEPLDLDALGEAVEGLKVFTDEPDHGLTRAWVDFVQMWNAETCIALIEECAANRARIAELTAALREFEEATSIYERSWDIEESVTRWYQAWGAARALLSDEEGT